MPRWLKITLLVIAGWAAVLIVYAALLLLVASVGWLSLAALVFVLIVTWGIWSIVDIFVP